jgi:hypothetical protein
MSTIPSYFEGTPLHSDNFIVNLKAGGTISIGNAVKLSAAWTVTATSAATDQLLGIAMTSASSGEPVAVLTRGVVDATASAAISAGAFVGAAAGGLVASITPLSAYSSGLVINAMALEAATGSGDVIQILLW